VFTTQTASSWRSDQNVCKLWKELDTRPAQKKPALEFQRRFFLVADLLVRVLAEIADILARVLTILTKILAV